MGKVTVYLRSEEEKKTLLTFLNSANYSYKFDEDVSNERLKELIIRKKDFIAGKTTSKSWAEIKKSYKK